MISKNTTADAVSQLCPNCGLCCDSTLFADVELRKGDDPRRLQKLGLEIQQKTKTKLAFAQPCACFDGKYPIEIPAHVRVSKFALEMPVNAK